MAEEKRTKTVAKEGAAGEGVAKEGVVVGEWVWGAEVGTERAVKSDLLAVLFGAKELVGLACGYLWLRVRRTSPTPTVTDVKWTVDSYTFDIGSYMEFDIGSDGAVLISGKLWRFEAPVRDVGFKFTSSRIFRVCRVGIEREFKLNDFDDDDSNYRCRVAESDNRYGNFGVFWFLADFLNPEETTTEHIRQRIAQMEQKASAFVHPRQVSMRNLATHIEIMQSDGYQLCNVDKDSIRPRVLYVDEGIHQPLHLALTRLAQQFRSENSGGKPL